MRLFQRQQVPRRDRRGFTLVEMIIAIIIMAVGVMGLAGTASYVAIQMGGGAMQTVAAGVAQTVTDSLSSRRCAQLVNGTDSTRGVRTTWTITDSTRARWVQQSVRYTTRRGVKTANYVAAVPCVD